MRKLFVFAVFIVLVVVAPSALANANYCAPEFGSCGGNGESGTFGTSPSPTAGGGGNGTYEKTYGTDYSACAASGMTRCLRCQYIMTKKAYGCVGVEYTGYCGCTEKYENYILKSCTSRGSCDYF